jgi:hypothetical protein
MMPQMSQTPQAQLPPVNRTAMNAVAVEDEPLGVTSSELEEMFGKLSDKWAWALVAISACGTLATAITGGKVPAIGYLVFVLSVISWLLDRKELGSKGYAGGWRWWGIVPPVYLFIRAAKTTKKYGYAIACVILVAVNIIVSMVVTPSIMEQAVQTQQSMAVSAGTGGGTGTQQNTDVASSTPAGRDATPNASAPVSALAGGSAPAKEIDSRLVTAKGKAWSYWGEEAGCQYIFRADGTVTLIDRFADGVDEEISSSDGVWQTTGNKITISIKGRDTYTGTYSLKRNGTLNLGGGEYDEYELRNVWK